ncbi:MAG TPA: hypothetical protein VEY51_14675, partial [Chondromyces sp.]|nr:hypothetical protein [Chondromyces sp.]
LIQSFSNLQQGFVRDSQKREATKTKHNEDLMEEIAELKKGLKHVKKQNELLTEMITKLKKEGIRGQIW